MTKSYLLEIGMEELPARYVADTVSQLKINTEELLKKERVQYSDIIIYTTPRRLALIIKGLEDMGTSAEEKVKGPSKKISFDEEGNPSKALQGFMRGQKVEQDSIIIEEVNGEEYVFARVMKKSKSLEQVFSSNMESFIKKINFPKTMKWGGKNLRFARPIRWILSLLDDETIPFEMEGIKVSNVTRGHRFLGSNNILIDHVDNYVDLLNKNYVIVDQEIGRAHV